MLNVREISRMGVVLLLMVLILLAVVRATSRIADAKTNLAKQLIGKTDAWYIATGEVEHASCMFRSVWVVDGFTRVNAVEIVGEPPSPSSRCSARK